MLIQYVFFFFVRISIVVSAQNSFTKSLTVKFAKILRLQKGERLISFAISCKYSIIRRLGPIVGIRSFCLCPFWPTKKNILIYIIKLSDNLYQDRKNFVILTTFCFVLFLLRGRQLVVYLQRHDRKILINCWKLNGMIQKKFF